MIISNLNSSFIIDADKQDEVIHFDNYGQTVGSGKYVYTKYRQLTSDFNRNPILNKDEYIRIKSLWCADLNTGTVEELVPYGQFDIQYTDSSDRYIYFFKVLDKDGDGRLGEDDYSYGLELWRVSFESKTEEFCLDCKGYSWHGYDLVNDEFIVFRSEDRLPDDATELVFVDIRNQRTASLVIPHGDDRDAFNFDLVKDKHGNPTHLITKIWVFEVEPSSPENTMNCITWDDLLGQLNWAVIP